MPYLIGPNSAEITPNSPSEVIRIGTDCRAKPAAAIPATKISANFTRRATNALSYLSASSPPRADRTKNGAIKITPARVARAPPPLPSMEKTMRMTSAFLAKLSLSAVKNCVQNNAAKRRDVMSSLTMVPIPCAARRTLHRQALTGVEEAESDGVDGERRGRSEERP